MVFVKRDHAILIIIFLLYAVKPVNSETAAKNGLDDEISHTTINNETRLKGSFTWTTSSNQQWLPEIDISSNYVPQ